MKRLLRRLFCLIGRHRLVRVVWLSPASEMIACYDCRKRFAMNHDVRAFLPYEDVRSLYEGSGGIYPRRSCTEVS